MSGESKSKSYRVQIIVAAIGFVGVVGAALIANWDKIFPGGSPETSTLNTAAALRMAEDRASKWFSAFQ